MDIIGISEADFCHSITLANQIINKFFDIGVSHEVGINALSIALCSGLIQFGCTKKERKEFFQEFCKTIIHPSPKKY